MSEIIINPSDVLAFYDYDYYPSTFDILSNLDELDNLEFIKAGDDDCLNKIPKVGGVYFICTEKQFLYIGYSKNIHRRLSGSHSKRKYISSIGIIIYWSECSYPALEYFLIRKLKPTLNKVWNQQN